MRDIILVCSILGFLGIAVVRPFVGLLTWSWFALMNPHQEAYTFAKTLPLNLAIALVTTLAWVVSNEPKKLPRTTTVWLVLIFLFWMTFNSFFAFDPSWSWPFWNRTWRIFAWGLLAAILCKNKVRFHALIWIAVISLGYYGVKGGIFTIMTGGGSHVYGPPSTIIADNNQLALALVMMLPLFNYLRLQSASRFIRLGLLAAMALMVPTILGTYSRGGMIALAALAGVFWLRTKRKLTYTAIAAAVGLATLNFMPPAFWARLDSIQNYHSDASFQGRVEAWHVAYDYAVDHFPFGAGFYGPQLHEIFHKYEPGKVAHAAHSIYFQVLGEHGFIGLAIYLCIFVASFFDLQKVKWETKRRPELRWAYDLADMLQLSLFAFSLGGAALSMAYYDLFVLAICLGVALRLRVRNVIADAPAGEPYSLPDSPHDNGSDGRRVTAPSIRPYLASGRN